MLWQVNIIMRLIVQLWNKTLKFCNFCQASSYVMAGLVSCFDLSVTHSFSCNRSIRDPQKPWDRSVYSCHCEEPLSQNTWGCEDLDFHYFLSSIKRRSQEQNLTMKEVSNCLQHVDRAVQITGKRMSAMGMNPISQDCAWGVGAP